MKKLSFLFIILCIAATVSAQFRNDNVLYKTVFPQDLCKELQVSKGYLLLDVRSPGEYADTSSSPGYNFGHLANAVNINVRELGKRISEIKDYKDKPVYVYCSHSQRSRRASKMLADSGFANVININGGVTAIRQLPEENCLNSFLVTTIGYKIISGSTLCKKLSGNAVAPFILDVRSDSAFRHIDLDPQVNSYGTVKKSVNIPLDMLKEKLAQVPRDKEIIVIDIFGDDAARAAVILHDNNYRNVSMLLEGLDRLNYTDSKDISCLKNNYSPAAKYGIMSSPDFRRFAEKNTEYLALDVRSKEEFAGKHQEYWRNIGHLVNAVNIPVAELAGKVTDLEKYRSKQIIVYGFGGGKEAHEAAVILQSKGFTNIHVLAGGLFNIRWTANNVSGNAALAKLVVDIPAENL